VQKGRGGENVPDRLASWVFPAAAREPTRRSVGRAWRRRVALFLQTWNSSSVIPRFLGVFLKKKFYMIGYVFKLLFFLIYVLL